MERETRERPPLRQVLWVVLSIAGAGLLLRVLPPLLDELAVLAAIGAVLGLLATEPNTDGWA
jgi:hypothetical protein